ncbi:mitochondrial ATPase inhibitor, IATP-domain-containing protein [Hypoxylon fragiforme]|uniref:mitochondrial ATPase inhibitor, IATP-domain-containing protein n=1 Tax=Hypoxylon fragiforme TaxID=63214 RepID=UPI0020C6B89D|nr:mitochondrial ATPase inhibitor, IATP-domain-containing protein [Hypoxylon fragiforme]KAI2614463.1 mitochondrial ATPase inhibitor, IATP-domain-containing protein [Hypoxylon fragiforme]
MYRQTLTKVPSTRRAFSTTVRAMAAGDTGSPNKYGSLGGSPGAWEQREKANEDYAIRMREKEKLLELRKKLREQQEHLQKLSEHIDELTKDQPGEQN